MIKILAALLKCDPILGGVACYHLLEIQEVDVMSGVYLTPERWLRRQSVEPGLTVQFFHLPTVSAWSLNTNTQPLEEVKENER